MAHAPSVVEVNTPEDFNAVVSMAQVICGRLESLDYPAIHAELTTLNIKSALSPSLQMLSQEMLHIQAVRDRLSEISLKSLYHSQTYKTVCDLLVDGWQKFSKESSADKRKAEALLKMAEFVFQQSEAETLHKAVMRVMDNVNAKQETISRQITCFSLQMKLGDTGRIVPEIARGYNGNFNTESGDISAWTDPDAKVAGDDVSKYDKYIK